MHLCSMSLALAVVVTNSSIHTTHRALTSPIPSHIFPTRLDPSRLLSRSFSITHGLPSMLRTRQPGWLPSSLTRSAATGKMTCTFGWSESNFCAWGWLVKGWTCDSSSGQGKGWSCAFVHMRSDLTFTKLIPWLSGLSGSLARWLFSSLTLWLSGSLSFPALRVVPDGAVRQSIPMFWLVGWLIGLLVGWLASARCGFL